MFACPVVAASCHGVGIHFIYSFGVTYEPLLRDHFKYLTLFSPDFSFFQEGYFLLFPAKWALFHTVYPVPHSITNDTTLYRVGPYLQFLFLDV